MKEKNKYQRTINKKNEEHRNIVEEVSYINLSPKYQGYFLLIV